MAMMRSMAVVITKYASMILIREEMVDESEIVANDVAACVFPYFLTQSAQAGGATDRSQQINSLAQPATRRHTKRILSQVGHSISYLKLVVDDFARAAADDAAYDAVALVGAVQDGFGFLDLLGGDDGDEAYAHVEGAEHLFAIDVS